MGVPLVALAGSRAVSRVGLALLSQVLLEHLVARDENDYVRIASVLARDLCALAEIRATLRQRVEAAPFSDAAACTREVEAAYRMMWRHWCARACLESDAKDAP